MADLQQLYGFPFPDDLSRVWELARRVRPLDPANAFAETLRLQLVGPFDVLAGRFDRHTSRYPIAQHWRYPLDPPELFTVLVGEGGLHWGYWFDAPGASVPCVVACYSDQGFEPTRYGDDLVTALRLYLEELASEGEDLDALRAMLFGADKCRGRIGRKTQRDAGVIAPTRDGLGIVAPPESYRALTISRARLWQDQPPAELLGAAQEACAAGYPATALQLGRELWAIPGEAHFDAACLLLDQAYEGLGRDVLRTVLADHRRHRGRLWYDILEQEAYDREPPPED